MKTEIPADIDFALKRANRMIKLPSMLTLQVPLLAYLISSKLKFIPENGNVAILSFVLAISVSFIGSWLIWSIQVPRWRLWALVNVKDIELLEKLAVERKIIWKKGSIFEKTEIASKENREKINSFKAGN